MLRGVMWTKYIIVLTPREAKRAYIDLLTRSITKVYIVHALYLVNQRMKMFYGKCITLYVGLWLNAEFEPDLYAIHLQKHKLRYIH